MVAGAVSGLEPGAYRYEPIQHELLAGTRGDHRPVIAEASVDDVARMHYVLIPR